MTRKEIEIFKAGKYPQGTFTREQLAAMATAYDAAFCEAPVTLDHVQAGPALGWVKGVRLDGDTLFADIEASPELVELVDKKLFKKRSVEFFRQLPGKGLYLKAVSFLGAQIPQVKGMRDVDFASFAEAESDAIDMEAAEAPVSFAEIERLRQERDAAVAKFEEIDAQRQAAEERLRALNMNSRRIEFETYVNERIAYGVLPPAMKTKAVRLLSVLDTVPMFSDASGQAEPVALFKEFLEGMPRLPKGPAAGEKAAQKSADKFYDAVKAAHEEATAKNV
jgi:hypothetical protein